MTNVADLISAARLSRETGATYRQIYYWTRTGVLEPTIHGIGSGSRSRYHRNLIGPVRTLAAVSAALRSHNGTGVSSDLCRAIVDAHATGELDLGDGIRLTWTP